MFVSCIILSTHSHIIYTFSHLTAQLELTTDIVPCSTNPSNLRTSITTQKSQTHKKYTDRSVRNGVRSFQYFGLYDYCPFPSSTG